MNITVNGKETTVDADTTVAALIEKLSLSPKTLIVEVSGDVLRQDAFDDAALKPGDTVELIQFVGGG